jgi:putative ABC transport system permease protein
MTTVLRQDVLVASRRLRRDRLFAVTAIASLALAIAVNTAVYGMFDAMINPRVGVIDADRLYRLKYFGDRRRQLGAAGVESALETVSRSYDAVTGYTVYGTNIDVRSADRNDETDPLLVRPNFFPALGIQPVSGQLAPAAASDERSIVISDRLRFRLFPRNTPAEGQVLFVDGHAASVIGVARRYEGFAGLDADVWIMAKPGEKERVPVNLIRLRGDVGLSQLDAILRMLAARLATAANEPAQETRFLLRPIARQFRIGPFQYALFGAVLAVMVIASIIIATLQYARGLSRSRELAVRCSLGASRWSLVRLLTIESGILVAAGLALGLLLAWWGIRLLDATVPGTTGGFVVAPQFTWGVITFALVAATVCVLVVGVIPAVRVSAVNLAESLKAGQGSGRHRASRRKYGLMVIVQAGLTLPVVCAATLLLHTEWILERHDYRVHRLFGYDPDSLVIAHLRLSAGPSTVISLSDIAAQFIAAATGVPNVDAAAVSVNASPVHDTISLADASNNNIRRVPVPMWQYRLVSPAYFRTLGRPMAAGRDFPDGGYTAPVAILDISSRTFLWARRGMHNAQIKFGDARATSPWIPIIGIAGDRLDKDGRDRRASIDTLRLGGVFKVLTTSDSVRGTNTGINMTLYAKVSENPARVAAMLKERLKGPGLAAAPRVRPMSDDIGMPQLVAQGRFITAIFVVFAVVCVGLSILGIYAVLVESITERRLEIAIRSALGASRRSTLVLVLQEGRALALAGLAVGLSLSHLSAGWLGMFTQTDDFYGAAFLAGEAMFVISITGLVAILTAVRATRIDAAEALRGV